MSIKLDEFEVGGSQKICDKTPNLISSCRCIVTSMFFRSQTFSQLNDLRLFLRQLRLQVSEGLRHARVHELRLTGHDEIQLDLIHSQLIFEASVLGLEFANPEIKKKKTFIIDIDTYLNIQ